MLRAPLHRRLILVIERGADFMAKPGPGQRAADNAESANRTAAAYLRADKSAPSGAGQSTDLSAFMPRLAGGEAQSHCKDRQIFESAHDLIFLFWLPHNLVYI